MTQYARPLYDKVMVRDFLRNVLGYDVSKMSKIISRIVDGELALAQINIEQDQTLNSPKYRDDKYDTDGKRWKLRKEILEDLITLKRLSDDDKIKLKKGGALPLGDLKSEKQAVIVIGLPASGKSSIASMIADKYGAVMLDSDFAKRKLPEYNEHIYGATIVHAESTEITFGFSNNTGNLKSLYAFCLENDHNIIIPKIGQSAKNILYLAKSLKEQNGYDVHLIAVELTKRDATKRALERFKRTSRYVPLGLIFDQYGNDSHLCYYYLRSKYSNIFKSFGAIFNGVDKGQEPICTDVLGDNCPIFLEYKLEQNIILL